MSVCEGLSRASRHLPSIVAWALISATVGIILHLIERRAGFIGRIATALAGGIWSLVTFFVVPILVLENKGVVDSVRESVSLMKKTWGESIVGSGSIMLIFVAIGIVGLLFVAVTVLVGNTIVFGSAVVLFIILVAVLAIVASAMQGIFVTALYTYARTGTIPGAFRKDLICNAFIPTRPGQAQSEKIPVFPLFYSMYLGSPAVLPGFLAVKGWCTRDDSAGSVCKGSA